MQDRNPNPTKAKLAVIGFVAAVIVFFFVIVPLLPFEAPYFPAEDSKDLAYRLFRKGDCVGGYAIFEKRAERATYDGSYWHLGIMKEEGRCGSPDLPGAIDAYRKAAAKGDCRANFELGRVEFMHPSIPGVTQIAHADNFFAATVCAVVTDDQELLSQYFEPGSTSAQNESLKAAFVDALARRAAYKKLPQDERRKIRKDIAGGIGFDANPNEFDLKSWSK